MRGEKGWKGVKLHNGLSDRLQTSSSLVKVTRIYLLVLDGFGWIAMLEAEALWEGGHAVVSPQRLIRLASDFVLSSKGNKNILTRIRRH